MSKVKTLINKLKCKYLGCEDKVISESSTPTDLFSKYAARLGSFKSTTYKCKRCGKTETISSIDINSEDL